MEPAKTVEGSIITRKEQDQEIARLKKENERLRQEREILKKAVVIMCYNSKMLHSYLGYLSPREFERRNKKKNVA